MAAQSHNERLIRRRKTTNLFIREKNSTNHAIFLALSPMRAMKIEKIQEFVFFVKNKGVIRFI